MSPKGDNPLVLFIMKPRTRLKIGRAGEWHGGDVYETEQYAISDLPRLLGVLDYVCAECARLVP